MTDQTSLTFRRRTSLQVAYFTATGAVHGGPATLIETSWQSALLLLHELSRRAVYPEAQVVNPLAERHSGPEAFRAHAAFQGMLVGQLQVVPTEVLPAIAATAVAYARDNSVEGLEGFLASLANLMYGRADSRATLAVTELAGSAINRSQFTSRFPFYVSQQNGITTAFDAGTAFAVDWEKLRKSLVAYDKKGTPGKSGDLSEFFGAGGPGSPDGASQHEEWFPKGSIAFPGDPTHGGASVSDIFREIDEAVDEGRDIGEILSPGAESSEPFTTNRERVSEGESYPVTISSDESSETDPGLTIAEAATERATAKAQSAAEANAQHEQTKAVLDEKLVGLNVAAFTIGLVVAANPVGLLVGGVLLTASILWAFNTAHKSDAVTAASHPGWNPPTVWTPNPDSDQGYGGVKVPYVGKRPVIALLGPKVGPTDGPDMVDGETWVDAMGTAWQTVNLVDPLWDPIDVLVVDGNDPHARPPKYLSGRILHPWVYYFGRGAAAFTVQIDAHKVRSRSI